MSAEPVAWKLTWTGSDGGARVELCLRQPEVVYIGDEVTPLYEHPPTTPEQETMSEMLERHDRESRAAILRFAQRQQSTPPEIANVLAEHHSEMYDDTPASGACPGCDLVGDCDCDRPPADRQCAECDAPLAPDAAHCDHDEPPAATADDPVLREYTAAAVGICDPLLTWTPYMHATAELAALRAALRDIANEPDADKFVRDIARAALGWRTYD